MMTSRTFGHAFLWYQTNHFTIHLYWKIVSRVAVCKHSACIIHYARTKVYEWNAQIFTSLVGLIVGPGNIIW